MSNIEILRGHEGAMTMHVGGQYAAGAYVAGIQETNGLGMCAVVYIPIKDVTLGEVKNVIPFLGRRS